MASNQQTAARRSLLFLARHRRRPLRPARGRRLPLRREDRPKLGLDLEGGTQIILEPKTTAGQTVSTEQLNQARDIIVQRVDAGGVSGAEVTTQGDRNIVVSIPEIPTQEVRDAISKSSQLQFRPVLAVAAGTPAADRHPVAERHGPASPSPSATPTTASSASPTSNSAVPEALTAPTPSPSASASPAPSPAPSGATPTGPTDLAWITDDLTAQFAALDCSDPAALENIVDDPTKPLVTCDVDGTAKYILGPVAVSGDKISDATSGLPVQPAGQRHQRGRDRPHPQR